MVKIGINGFGRLGRLLLRVGINKCKEKCATDTPRIVMVNDPILNPDTKNHLFNNDTFHGKSNMEIIETGSSLTIDGQRVEFTTESVIERIPWKKCQVDYVIDTTGKHITCEKASMFLNEGIKRVIVSGCSKVPMFVVGVNHCCYDPKMKVVSAATPQMNCLTCLLRVLNENFDIQEVSASVIQPLTNEDRILDDNMEGIYRYCRSSIGSFAPAKSLTENNFINKIIPELDGKTVSTAIKVPVPCVGAIDCTVKLGKEAPQEVINCRLKEASESYMKGLIRFSTEELISSDIIGDPNSCVVDSKTGVSLSKCTAKVFAWYDSELSFANRLYELANYVASREDCQK